MRFKTYLATYLLFLFILFLCFGVVSAYMASSQINILREKSIREYQTISRTLVKDISALDRIGWNLNMLVDGYANYYRQNNITIQVTEISYLETQESDDYISVSFLQRDKEHYVHISSTLIELFEFYKLDYYYNATQDIKSMRNMQNILLLICIAFSVITGFVLYFILSSIFKPLGIVSRASRKIASGHYHERIYIKGNNELYTMASDFNSMAEEIEKQIQILKEETDGKQRFIDNFAHEIRTPLTSIYGNAEYMQKALLDEGEIIELSQFIMKKTNHIKKISNSLLQLATLRNYTPIKTQILIQRLFEDISQTVKRTMDEQNIRFTYKSEVEVLQGEEELIKSLLLNLCFNAIKACIPNEGIICMEAKKYNKSIMLSITDNGFGIPEESIARVTEPFYQVHKEQNRNNGGAGLGLSLCKQIAESHGAELTIESLRGNGTTVKIIFTSS